MLQIRGAKGLYTLGALSPLHTVVEYGHPALFEALAAKFPDEMRDAMALTGFGLGFLHWAVFQIGSVDAARAVIDVSRALGLSDAAIFGAHPITDKEALANVAPLVRRAGVPRLLLAAGVLPEQPCGFVGCLQYAFMEATALHVAAYAANLTCVQLLLECKGVDVNSQQHARRMTPLMLAAMGGHDEIVEALRAHGARLEPTDSLGRTARAWARRFGHSPDDLPALRPEWRPAEAPPRDGSATPR